MTVPPSSPFPLTYALHGGRPSVDISFTVEADSTCLIDVLTGYSLGQSSPVRLGTFSGRLPPRTMQGLTRWANNVRSGDTGVALPGTVSRFLGRAGGGLRPVDKEPPASLDESLLDAGRAALASPLSAVEVEAQGEPSRPKLVITGIGMEPFHLLLFARDVAGFWPRLRRDDPMAAEGGSTVPFEEIQGLVDRGEIREGVFDLAPGESVSLPLPPSAGGGPASGSFIFWRPGQGAERRILAGQWSLQER